MSSLPCPDCFSGTVHIGTPTGTENVIHGLRTYVAKPPEGVTPNGIIVFIPDAFGWEFINNRILSDNYAKQGSFLVYMPDFMNGNSLPFQFMEIMEEKVKKPSPSWFTTLLLKPIYLFQAMRLILPWIFLNRSSICKPRIFNFLKAIRTTPPPFPTNNLKMGAAGFCWGGYYAIQLLHDQPAWRVARSEPASSGAPEPLVDCAFVAHPSMLSVPGDIEAVKLPLSLAVGNEDMAMKPELILKVKEILEAKKGGEHQVVLLEGAKHGFAIRVDPKDELQNRYAAEAEVQAVEWFTRWFT